jgi:hypothetical protein
LTFNGTSFLVVFGPDGQIQAVIAWGWQEMMPVSLRQKQA